MSGSSGAAALALREAYRAGQFGNAYEAISPTIFFVLTMGIIGSFQVFTAAFILGASYDFAASAGPLDSLLFWVLYIYHQGFFFFKQGYASALAWVLFVVILAVTLLQLWLSRRWVYYEADAAGS
jgi:multiple sugar transport system permease protein